MRQRIVPTLLQRAGDKTVCGIHGVVLALRAADLIAGPLQCQTPLGEPLILDALQGAKVDLVPVEVPAGGCAIHAGGTWHGSDANRTARPRRSLVTHCLASEARFHPTQVSYIYSRYHRVGDDAMDESFFPVLWTRSGDRSAYLEAYLA